MDEQVYPLMLHHEYSGEQLLGTCFAYRNNQTFVTAGHCLDGITQDSDIHIGILAEVQKNSPLPDKRTVRKALSIARHRKFDIAVITSKKEWCDAPLTEPFFHPVHKTEPQGGETIKFRGYTDDRLGDNKKIIGRTKKGSVTLNYQTDSTNPRPIIEIQAHVEHKNSGAPVLLDEPNTGTPIAMVVTLKGGSNSKREDSHGEALLLHPFISDLNLAVAQNYSALGEEWEILISARQPTLGD